MKKLFKNRMFMSVFLSVVLTFALVFAVAYSATTISTDITTAGTLTIATTINGPLQANAGVVSATTTIGTMYGGTGLSTGGLKANYIPFGAGISAFATSSRLYFVSPTLTVNFASTTNITNTGDFWVNGFATTTGSSGDFATKGTITATGAVWASSTLQTTGNLWSYAKIGAGTSTPIAEISATSTAATTTLYLSSDSATKGGCIQIEGVDGAVYRMVAGYAATATTTGGIAGFTAYWEVGACK